MLKNIKFLVEDNLEHNVSSISDRNEATNIYVRYINNLCVTGYYNSQHKLDKYREVNPEKKNNMECYEFLETR